MKKCIRYFGVLLTEYFTYPLIYLSVVLFVLLCIFGSDVYINNKEYSVFEILFNSNIMAEAEKNFQCNAYAVMSAFNSSAWFSVAVPVITAFPALAVFEQTMHNTRRQVLVRTNKRVYSSGLFGCAFLTGFIISLTGILLYSAAVYSFFPPISAFPNDAEFINAIYGNTESERFIEFFIKVINCCIMCGIFPPLTLIIYQILHDRFLAVTVPMMAQYVSFKGSVIYSSWLYSDEKLYSNGWLNFIYFLFPSNCMQHYFLWENTLHLPFFCFFIFAGIIIIILYLIFDRLNRRSIGEGL